MSEARTTTDEEQQDEADGLRLEAVFSRLMKQRQDDEAAWLYLDEAECSAEKPRPGS